ncbi:MAG: acyl carrier protein [Mycobacterium sp.]|nr:MAG: acyl carrier protein [Mycobacterium sp.]
MTVDDWDGKGPLDEEESVDERVRRAIEASSLGTEAARAVRAQVGPGVGDALLDRVRARLAVEGLPGGAAPAAMEPAAGDVGVAGDSAAPVASPAGAESCAVTEEAAGRLPDEHVEQLMGRYFRPGIDDAETVSCAGDPRRARVLAVLAECIEEVTGRAADGITEETRFREDLSMDSLAAVEISTALEDEFLHLKVSAGQLSSLQVVSDAIDLLLGHVAVTTAPEFDAPMSPTTSATTTASPPRRRKTIND